MRQPRRNRDTRDTSETVRGPETGGGTSAAEYNNRREDTQEPAEGLGEGGKPRDHPELAEEPEKWSAREAGKPEHSKEYIQAGQ